MIVPISDRDDPRIAAYRDVRERDLAGRDGLFVAEGEVVLRVLLGQTRIAVASLFLAEKRVAALAPMIDALPADVPVFVAPQEIMDGIVGFPMHRGMLALGRRPAGVSADALLAGLPPRAVVIGVFAIANHDNMGGIFRNAAAFGADAVILDSDCCDPLYRKAIRVSVGGALRVPFARLNRGEDALALFGAHGFETLALSPAGATTLADVQRAPRVAALFGAEGPGLPEDILARATTVRIAMGGGFNSLNVATASGIVLNRLMGG